MNHRSYCSHRDERSNGETNVYYLADMRDTTSANNPYTLIGVAYTTGYDPDARRSSGGFLPMRGLSMKRVITCGTAGCGFRRLRMGKPGPPEILRRTYPFLVMQLLGTRGQGIGLIQRAVLQSFQYSSRTRKPHRMIRPVRRILGRVSHEVFLCRTVCRCADLYLLPPPDV